MVDEYSLPDAFVKPYVNLVELEPRDNYLRGVVDLRDIGVSTLDILRLGRKGQILDDAIVDNLNFFHIQSINMPQEERVQMVPNHSDDGKGYYFGRTHRMYAVAGFMVDSNLAQGQGSHPSEFALGGKTYSYWKRVYEDNMRITQCIRRNQIVRIRWRQTTMYGYVMSQSASMDSMNPFQTNVNFAFLSIVETEQSRLPIVQYSNPDSSPSPVGPAGPVPVAAAPMGPPIPKYFKGSISQEGARRILGIPAPTRNETPEFRNKKSRVGKFVTSRKKT